MKFRSMVTKLGCPALLFTLSGTSLVAQEGPDQFASFIRQNQLASGISWQMPIELRGEGLSPLAIEEEGALLQLWAVNTSSYQDYLIDQKLVGAYLPRGEIRITTRDPYQAVPRTRADQPFEVHFEVSGLLSGPNMPEAATKVLIEHYAAHYPESLTLKRDEALVGNPIRSDSIEKNGVTLREFPVSSLTGPDPTKISGEEHFLMHALPDGDLVQTQIASAMIQIWPVASGRIDGLRNGDIVGLRSPKLTLTLDDLYPSSATFLHVYPGSPALGREGTKLSGSILVLDQNKSEDRVLTVGHWTGSMAQEGLHTMELLTKTPFGIDRLDYVTFTVDRTIEVRAMMIDVE